MVMPTNRSSIHRGETLLELKTILLVLALLAMPARVSAQSLTDPGVVELFSVAKEFFAAIEKRDYAGVWEGITAKSREGIVDAIYKEQKEIAESATREKIREDLDTCGVMCKSFWNAYFATFDPEGTLKDSRWDFGFIKKKKAEIWITAPRADRPAKLKLFREEGKWKVGLMETFWTYWSRRG